MKKLIMSIVAIATLSVTGANANSLAEKMLNPNDFKGLLEVNKDQICGPMSHGDVRKMLNSKVDFPEKYDIIMKNAFKREHQEKLRKASGDERAVQIAVTQQLNKTLVDEKTGIVYSVNLYDPIGGIIQVYSSSRGEISFDLLKQLGGVGMSTKLGWAQFIRNYADFNIYINSQANPNSQGNDKYDQFALYLNSIYIEDLKTSVKQGAKNLNDEEINKLTSIIFYGNRGGMGIDEFLDFLDKHKYNAKLKKLFKDVILYKKDNAEILEYMKKENERSGIIEDLKEMELACHMSNTQTIGDVIKTKITQKQFEDILANSYIQKEKGIENRIEKAKNENKEKICNINYQYDVNNDVFTVQDYIDMKNSNNRSGKFQKKELEEIYEEMKKHIKEKIYDDTGLEETYKTRHVSSESKPFTSIHVFEEACKSETTKTIDDIRNYEFKFLEFRERSNDEICSLTYQRGIDISTLRRDRRITGLILVGERLGIYKETRDYIEACSAWFNGDTHEDLIRH